ncbi:GGDEF domain-containing protein [Roseospirillum parvum]|uniref:diguanylate cyclase n=1 Tax=Roseospirillum parvum TaxID=83401 RepID=A0A1G7ZTV5_9PROT|nr:GGDEF domain-containing protein [Roseospirillum parvum]SDH12108.1 diguanylate cyclase (GGDEF) domain-containing protein [Roseospirillum parvum]
MTAAPKTAGANTAAPAAPTAKAPAATAPGPAPGRLLFSLGLPLLLVGLAAALARGLLPDGGLSAGPLPVTVSVLLGISPYALVLLGVPLCAQFHRSRLVFALLALGLASWVCLALVPDSGGPPGRHGQFTFAALALLLPLNLTALAWLDERGVLTRPGLIVLAVGAAQVLVIGFFASGLFGLLDAAAADALAGHLGAALRVRLFDPRLDAWTWLPQPALLAFAGAAVALLTRAVISRRMTDGALLGALLGAALGLHHLAHPPAAAVGLASAALAMVAATVQESYRMAFHDELTGIPSRRALMTDLGKLSGSYTIAMADVDHFKAFNDTHGHDVGDQVLRMVAACLARVGGGGKAYRYGGEEFTLLFPGRAPREAGPHLESVRTLVESSGFVIRGPDRPPEPPETPPSGHQTTRVKVTISLGAAGGEAKSDPLEVIQRADKALYKAKEAGRNRVMLVRPRDEA